MLFNIKPATSTKRHMKSGNKKIAIKKRGRNQMPAPFMINPTDQTELLSKSQKTTFSTLSPMRRNTIWPLNGAAMRTPCRL